MHVKNEEIYQRICKNLQSVDDTDLCMLKSLGRKLISGKICNQIWIKKGGKKRGRQKIVKNNKELLSKW